MDGWKPWPGPQEEFCSRGEYEVLFGGTKGPGKTDCLIADATRLIEHPYYKGLILRRTFPRLQEVIDRCHAIYPSLGGEYRAGEHRWYFPSKGYGPGARIQLGHVQHEDNKRDYHGKEFHYIGFDELTEFTETQYDFILANIRMSKAGLNIIVRATTNPGGIGHAWVKKRFIDVCKPEETKEYMSGEGFLRVMGIPKVYIDPVTGTSRCFVPATVYDNPSIMINDPGYVKRLEGLPDVEKRRLLFGEWDVFEGQAFSEISRRVHGCDDFVIPAEWERFLSFDWGFSKPFSIAWYAVDYDGVLYRYREWYGCKENTADVGLRMSNIEIGRGIIDREERERVKYRVADPHCWDKPPARGGVQGRSVIEDLSDMGLYFLKADNNRILGRNQVHERLKVETEIEESTGEILKEYSRLVVFNSCKHWWRTMELLREDEKNPEDIDTDQEDHIYDEFRYACMSRPIIPKRRINGPPPGSFAAERNKYIRAKKYAQRHGVSMSAAYSMMR